jgi:hypothetical protein
MRIRRFAHETGAEMMSVNTHRGRYLIAVADQYQKSRSISEATRKTQNKIVAIWKSKTPRTVSPDAKVRPYGVDRPNYPGKQAR